MMELLVTTEARTSNAIEFILNMLLEEGNDVRFEILNSIYNI
jgi:hypothetical protein